SPNYKRHYKVGNAQTDFEKLNARYYKNKNVSTLLSELYKLRNFNPINHSSAEIIEDKMLKKSQITNLIKQAETLLFDSFSS
ncbi:TPA: abortive infection protein, partial [Staphylococcus aureus]|nr:abortive infection protein [Staphylococcus aureus]